MDGTPRHPYFGYGSNLDRVAMAERCPDARYLGVARLSGWTLYMDSNGYATIAEEGGAVEGTLWLVSEADIASLDDYEGIDRGLYEKRTVTVDPVVAETCASSSVCHSCGSIWRSSSMRLSLPFM